MLDYLTERTPQPRWFVLGLECAWGLTAIGFVLLWVAR